MAFLPARGIALIGDLTGLYLTGNLPRKTGGSQEMARTGR